MSRLIYLVLPLWLSVQQMLEIMNSDQTTAKEEEEIPNYIVAIEDFNLAEVTVKVCVVYDRLCHKSLLLPGNEAGQAFYRQKLIKHNLTFFDSASRVRSFNSSTLLANVGASCVAMFFRFVRQVEKAVLLYSS